MTGKTGASPNLTTFRSKSVTSGIHTDISQTSKLVQPDAHSPTKNSNCFSTPQTKWQEQFKPAAGREPSAHTETRSSSKPSTPTASAGARQSCSTPPTCTTTPKSPNGRTTANSEYDTAKHSKAARKDNERYYPCPNSIGQSKAYNNGPKRSAHS